MSRVSVMSWRVSVGFAVTFAAAAAGFAGVPARADEAYLCGPDSVVYVAAVDLEAKKRTDPCIAAYYGLTVEKPAPKAAEVTPFIAPVVPRKVPAPAAARAVAQLKALSAREIPSRVEQKPGRQALLEPLTTTQGPEYRNVKILNSASPADAWFRHTK